MHLCVPWNVFNMKKVWYSFVLYSMVVKCYLIWRYNTVLYCIVWWHSTLKYINVLYCIFRYILVHSDIFSYIWLYLGINWYILVPSQSTKSLLFKSPFGLLFEKIWSPKVSYRRLFGVSQESLNPDYTSHTNNTSHMLNT